MEAANRIASAAIRAVNNNTVISVCLVGSFVALGVRSANQQRNIEALEAERDSLIKSNKDMKKAMWDWKHQLFTEADTHEALVPLSRLKAIYGEAPIARNDDVHDNANSPAAASKLQITIKHLGMERSSKKVLPLTSGVSVGKYGGKFSTISFRRCCLPQSKSASN